MANKWTMFVREWASKNNMSYGCAMTKQECKDAYKKENPTPSKSTNRRKKIAKEEKKSVSEVVREEVDNSKIVDLEEAIPTKSVKSEVKDVEEKVSSKRKWKAFTYQGIKYAYDKETKEVITRKDFDNKNYENTIGEYNEDEKELYFYDDVPEDYTGEGLSNACWKGYEAIGMKKKGKKLVPNCVPMKDESFNIITLKDGRRGIMKDNKFIEIEGVGIHKTENYYIQSVVFEKNMFSLKEARKWLKENNYVSKKPDITDTQIRFRQVNPKYIENKGFDRFRTKKLGKKSGISLIIAYKNKMKGGAIKPNNQKKRKREPTEDVNISEEEEQENAVRLVGELNRKIANVIRLANESRYLEDTYDVYMETDPPNEKEQQLFDISKLLFKANVALQDFLDIYRQNPIDNYAQMHTLVDRVSLYLEAYNKLKNEP